MLRTLPTLLLGTFLLAGSGLFLYGQRLLSPVQLTSFSPILIDSQGALFQDGTKIAQFSTTATGQEVHLIPPASLSCTTQSNLLAFPGRAAATSLSVSYQSLRGSGGFSITPAQETTRTLRIPCSVSEAHSSITLTQPRGTYSLRTLEKIALWVNQLPSVTWMAVPIGYALYLLITLGPLVWRPRIARKLVTDQMPLIHPTTVSILIDGRVSQTTIIASFYELFQLGYLHLIDQGSDLRIFPGEVRDRSLLRDEQRLLLNLLLPPDQPNSWAYKAMRELNRNVFSEISSTLYLASYTSLIESGYVRDNPEVIHLSIKTRAIVVQLLCCVFLLPLLVMLQIPIWYTLALATTYLLANLAYRLGRKALALTPAGREAYKKLLAFRQFMTTPEPLMLPMGMHGPLYDYFGYATALHCGQAWLNRFPTVRAFPTWLISNEADYTTPSEFFTGFDKAGSFIAEQVLRVADPNND